MTSLTQRDTFIRFLKEHTAHSEQLMPHFDAYLQELYSRNQVVNMVSRQMPREDYWTYHFLDSLLILKCMGSLHGNVLDFGTGGGLPGIPLAFVFPSLQVTLLDSVGKKIQQIKEMLTALHLDNVSAVWSRLEEYAPRHAAEYDYIVCRSVRIEESFIPALARLLKKDGTAVFYKSHQAEDVIALPLARSCVVSTDVPGYRQIVTVPQQGLSLYLKEKLG